MSEIPINWWIITFEYTTKSLNTSMDVPENKQESGHDSICYHFNTKTSTHFILAQPRHLLVDEIKQKIDSIPTTNSLVIISHVSHLDEFLKMCQHVLNINLQLIKKNTDVSNQIITIQQVTEEIAACASKSIDLEKIKILDHFILQQGGFSMGLLVDDVMTKKVRRGLPDFSLHAIQQHLAGNYQKKRVRNLPIVKDTKSEEVVGFVDDRELLRALPSYRDDMDENQKTEVVLQRSTIKISESVMRKDPLVIEANMSIEDAGILLCRFHSDGLNYNAALVVDDMQTRRLIGLFSYIDVLKNWKDTGFAKKLKGKTAQDIMMKSDTRYSFGVSVKLPIVTRRIIMMHEALEGHLIREMPILDADNKIVLSVRDRTILELASQNLTDYTENEMEILLSKPITDEFFEQYVVTPATIKVSESVDKAVEILSTRREDGYYPDVAFVVDDDEKWIGQIRYEELMREA